MSVSQQATGLVSVMTSGSQPPARGAQRPGRLTGLPILEVMRRVGVAAVLLAVVAAVAGCSTPEGASPAPASTPSAPAPSPTASAAGPTTRLQVAPETAGSGGLTVRYRDADGSVKTLKVQDFPR